MLRSVLCSCFFFQAEDGIRDLVRSRGLGDVYKRQALFLIICFASFGQKQRMAILPSSFGTGESNTLKTCLLYTSDAADERSSVDLGGRRIIKKKKKDMTDEGRIKQI